MKDQKVHKKLKKKLKKLDVKNQLDLINLMIGVVSRRISVEDIEIRNWIEKSVDGLSLEYRRMDEEIINLLLEYDLSMLVSEADSFLGDIRRTETGSFYTPIEWVKYMTRIALDDWMQSVYKMDEVQSISLLMLLSRKYDEDQAESLVESLSELKVSKDELRCIADGLKNICVVDIACGAGAFLLETVELLSTVYTNISFILEGDHDYKKTARRFLTSSVAGIDLQAEPLAVYTLCLLWRYADKEEWKLDPFIIRGSSLSQELFTSDEGLSAVLKNGGFDIVLGNPPYLGEKGNTSVFKEVRKTTFGQRHYEGKMDLSYFFTLKSLELLKPSGSLTYLTTNYFITADGAAKYRQSLREKAWFSHVLNFNTYPVFKDALGQHNMIYMLKPYEAVVGDRKAKVKYVLNNAYIDRVELCYEEILLSGHDPKYVNAYECDPDGLFTPDGTISILSDDNHKEILEAYNAFCDIKLRDVFNINQGIVSGADQVSGLMLRSKLPKNDIKKYNLEKGDPIFVFNDEDPRLGNLETDLMRPFYKNSDIGAYTIQPRTRRTIVYLDGYEDHVENEYPNVISHLRKFKPVLEARREVKTGTRPWYALQWPRKPEVFEGSKIVVPQRSRTNRFAYTEQPFYCSADVYYFKEKSTKASHAWQSPLDIKAWLYYLGVLNSSMLYLWLYHNGKRKGELLELYAKPLLDTAAPCYRGLPWQQKISAHVEKIMMCDAHEDIEVNRRAVDELIFEAMSLRKDEIQVIADFLERHKDV